MYTFWILCNTAPAAGAVFSDTPGVLVDCHDIFVRKLLGNLQFMQNEIKTIHKQNNIEYLFQNRKIQLILSVIQYKARRQVAILSD